MKEQLPRSTTGIPDLFNLDSQEANRDFIEQLDALQALHDPQTQSDAEASILQELQELADEMGVELLDLNDPKLRDLSKLPFREIERRLGVTKQDYQYGRTAYVTEYPRAKQETPQEAKRIEEEYQRITDALLQDEAQIEEEYNRLLSAIRRGNRGK